MTDGPGDGGFSVTPQPLGGSPRGTRARQRRLAIGIVGAAAAAIFAISWLGPQLPRPSLDGRSVATPMPTLGPSPLEIYASPLPALTGEAGRFSGTVGVVSDAFRVLDLGTGETITSMPVFDGRDVVFRAPGGGWVCVCTVGGSVLDVQYVHIDQLGHELERRTIGRLGTASGPDRSISVWTGLDLAADGQTGILAVAVQGPSAWTYSIASLDLKAGTLGPLMPLGTQQPQSASPRAQPTRGPPGPSGESPPSTASQTIAVGPQVRLAPGGHRAFVWATVHAGDEATGVTDSVGWTIRLDEHGKPTKVDPVQTIAGLTTCLLGGFLTPDQFVAICVVPGPAVPEWSIREFAPDGGLIRRVAVPDLGGFSSDMLFDTANDAIWVWNGSAMHLRRIDAATGSVTDRTFDREAETATGGEPIGGAAPAWIRPDAMNPGPFWGQMAGSRPGTRLYLLGYASEPGPLGGPQSLGIFVVDPTTMALLGRWRPDATYLSIHMGLDDSVVMASGMSGVDERAELAFWDASVTFHDAVDGRILARYGRLGDFSAPLIIEP
jgi:hypothetical protein